VGDGDEIGPEAGPGWIEGAEAKPILDEQPQPNLADDFLGKVVGCLWPPAVAMQGLTYRADQEAMIGDEEPSPRVIVVSQTALHQVPILLPNLS
jgi:hypothetical protein